jgi:hypothetical protein
MNSVAGLRQPLALLISMRRSQRYWPLAIAAILVSCANSAQPNRGSVAQGPQEQPSGRSSSATSTVPTGSDGLAVAPGYCDSKDTAIPGASVQGTPNEPTPGSLNSVELAWFSLNATIVPACSEVINDPVPFVTKNLTNGLLSDPQLHTLAGLATNQWTLWEWAGQHDQWGLEQHLYPAGNAAISFIRSGGMIVDQSRACEYPSKVYAVSIDGTEMAHLTGGRLTGDGWGLAVAWSGPCNTAWIAPSGQVTNYPTPAGQEFQELEIMQEATAPALGEYLWFEASVDPGSDDVAAQILQESGI